MQSDAGEIVFGETEAGAFLNALKCSLSSGDELHAFLCRLGGADRLDAKFYGCCRLLQKALERGE